MAELPHELESEIQTTVQRYRSSSYALRYQSAYLSGVKPRHLRSRFIAKREVSVISRMLRGIDDLGETLVDVPCGTGKLGRVLSELPVRVVAADASCEMMAWAADEYDGQFLGFQCADVRAMPVASASIGTVVCLRLFQRLPDETRRCALREFARITAKNLIVSYSLRTALRNVHSRIRSLYARSQETFYRVDQAQLHWELREAGFEVKTTEYVQPFLSTQVIVHAVPTLRFRAA